MLSNDDVIKGDSETEKSDQLLVDVRFEPDAGNIDTLVLYSNILHCLQKKHPLTFSFIFQWKMFRFTQNFQSMFKRN